MNKSNLYKLHDSIVDEHDVAVEHVTNLVDLIYEITKQRDAASIVNELEKELKKLEDSIRRMQSICVELRRVPEEVRIER
jgi:Mg2+ and Co2+ transporter CorA